MNGTYLDVYVCMYVCRTCDLLVSQAHGSSLQFRVKIFEIFNKFGILKHPNVAHIECEICHTCRQSLCCVVYSSSGTDTHAYIHTHEPLQKHTHRETQAPKYTHTRAYARVDLTEDTRIRACT